MLSDIRSFRKNKIIIPMLNKLCVEKLVHCYKYFDCIQKTIINSTLRSSGIEPFKIMIGLKMENNDNTDIRLY